MTHEQPARAKPFAARAGDFDFTRAKPRKEGGRRRFSNIVVRICRLSPVLKYIVLPERNMQRYKKTIEEEQHLVKLEPSTEFPGT